MFSDLKYRLYSLGFVCFIDFLKILMYVYMYRYVKVYLPGPLASSLHFGLVHADLKSGISA